MLKIPCSIKKKKKSIWENFNQKFKFHWWDNDFVLICISVPLLAHMASCHESAAVVRGFHS